MIVALSLVIAVVVFLSIAHDQNRKLDITDYAAASDRLPASFDGMVIAQVSDYHGDDTCRGQILQSLTERKPDIIVITGDLFDPMVEEESLDFALCLADRAPTYFITGNHEARVDRYSEMEKRLREGGVIVLRNEVTELSRGEESIRIAGADDEEMGNTADYDMLCDDDVFTILLSHRPANFEEYAAAGAEIVLCGHAHGGQFRIPGMSGGLIEHGQKHTQGMHTMDGTVMVVSRGIANTYFPPRFCNPPELVYVTLSCA